MDTGPSLEELVAKEFEKDGIEQIECWMLEGPAVSGSTPWDKIVSYRFAPGGDLEKLVPLGVGWRCLFDIVEAAIDDDSWEGDVCELGVAWFKADELAAIDTKGG